MTKNGFSNLQEIANFLKGGFPTEDIIKRIESTINEGCVLYCTSIDLSVKNECESFYNSVKDSFFHNTSPDILKAIITKAFMEGAQIQEEIDTAVIYGIDNGNKRWKDLYQDSTLEIKRLQTVIKELSDIAKLLDINVTSIIETFNALENKSKQNT